MQGDAFATNEIFLLILLRFFIWKVVRLRLNIIGLLILWRVTIFMFYQTKTKHFSENIFRE